MEAASRLDSGVTALVLGLFAMMWFGWGQADASSVVGTALAVGSIVALLVAALGGIRTFRSRRTDGALNEPTAQRQYAMVVGIEAVAAGVGAAALGATAGAAYIPVWICAVVGLHSSRWRRCWVPRRCGGWARPLPPSRLGRCWSARRPAWPPAA